MIRLLTATGYQGYRQGVTISTASLKAVASIPLKPLQFAFLQMDGLYWDYKGIAPDGTLRLYARAAAPYRRTVKHLQTDGTWTDQTSPGRPRPAAWWTGAAAVLLFAVVTAAFSDDPNPGPLQWGTGAALVLAVIAVLLLALPSSSCVDAWDEAAMVDTGPEHSYADYLQQFQQEEQARRLLMWQQAIFEQVSGRVGPAGPRWPTP